MSKIFDVIKVKKEIEYDREWIRKFNKVYKQSLSMESIFEKIKKYFLNK